MNQDRDNQGSEDQTIVSPTPPQGKKPPGDQATHSSGKRNADHGTNSDKQEMDGSRNRRNQPDKE